jgi:hypothetical protein
MSTAAGPFPMERSYTFSETPNGAAMMELRNRGRPSGFGTLVAPAMAGAMKRALMTPRLNRWSTRVPAELSNQLVLSPTRIM